VTLRNPVAGRAGCAHDPNHHQVSRRPEISTQIVAMLKAALSLWPIAVSITQT
jgi:hypothetical protein